MISEYEEILETLEKATAERRKRQRIEFESTIGSAVDSANAQINRKHQKLQTERYI